MNDHDHHDDLDVWPDDDAHPPPAAPARARWPAIVAALVVGALIGAIGFALQQNLEHARRADVAARAPAAAGGPRARASAPARRSSSCAAVRASPFRNWPRRWASSRTTSTG